MIKYFLPLLFLLLTGCTHVGAILAPTPVARGTFLLQLNMDEGKNFLSLEGASRALPGETLTYTLRLNNKSDQPWQDTYCLLLIDRVGKVTPITRGVIELAPGALEDHPLQVSYAPLLDPDSYGLALVIPGKTSSVTTVHLNSDAPLPPPGFESPKECPE